MLFLSPRTKHPMLFLSPGQKTSHAISVTTDKTSHAVFVTPDKTSHAISATPNKTSHAVFVTPDKTSHPYFKIFKDLDGSALLDMTAWMFKWGFCAHVTGTVKHVKRLLSKRPKIGFQDQSSLNAGQSIAESIAPRGAFCIDIHYATICH